MYIWLPLQKYFLKNCIAVSGCILIFCGLATDDVKQSDTRVNDACWDGKDHKMSINPLFLILNVVFSLCFSSLVAQTANTTFTLSQTSRGQRRCVVVLRLSLIQVWFSLKKYIYHAWASVIFFFRNEQLSAASPLWPVLLVTLDCSSAFCSCVHRARLDDASPETQSVQQLLRRLVYMLLEPRADNPEGRWRIWSGDKTDKNSFALERENNMTGGTVAHARLNTGGQFLVYVNMWKINLFCILLKQCIVVQSPWCMEWL